MLTTPYLKCASGMGFFVEIIISYTGGICTGTYIELLAFIIKTEMEIRELLLKIRNFKVDEEIEDYEISEYFDEIRESLTDLSLLTELQKEELIDALFEFLKGKRSVLPYL